VQPSLLKRAVHKNLRRDCTIVLLLVAATVAAYWQVCGHGFVYHDDDMYVYENPHVQEGLTPANVVWAFARPHIGHWHPLTWLSYMVDVELFGVNPGALHRTNLLLHVVNTVLLFVVLRRLTGAPWRSAFVAALFALHPLHVEPVAWISSRKDVLSGVFLMLTMLAYARYVDRPGVLRYSLVVLLFALGLMSKPMLVTLPFVLLLLDYWPLGRFQFGQIVKSVGQQSRKSLNAFSHWKLSRHLLLEKIPLFALSAISSIVTFLVQRTAGAVTSVETLPLKLRIANTFVSYLTYIQKMVWPSRLAMFYPYPDKTDLIWQTVVFALLLLIISLGVVWLMRRRRYLLTGWLWYLGTLVPVIGLVQVGDQALADRYTYVPLTGLFIIIAWGVPDLIAKWRFRKPALAASAIAVLLALSICAYLQHRHWRDTITLCEHALEVTEDNYVAHFCMADDSLRKGKIDRAIADYRQCLRIKPSYFKALGGLAAALRRQGKTDQAIKYYTQAIRRKPGWVFPVNNLAWLLATHKETKFRNPKEAVRLAHEACKLTNYENPTILDTLAAAYAIDNKFHQAIQTAEKALELAEVTRQKKLTEQIRNRLRLYKAGRPYIEPSAKVPSEEDG